MSVTAGMRKAARAAVLVVPLAVAVTAALAPPVTLAPAGDAQARRVVTDHAGRPGG
jgi:hypothetical protein